MIQRSLLVAALLLLGVAPSWAGAFDRRETRDATVDQSVIRLVGDIEEVGRDVRYHAGRLTDLAGQPGVSPWAHYHHLDTIKDIVNHSLRPTLRRLSDLQTTQPEWKQESIERMLAAARQLAADLSSAYVAKSLRVPPVLNDGYRQFIADVAAHADALVTTADAAHGYAIARMKAADAGLVQLR